MGLPARKQPARPFPTKEIENIAKDWWRDQAAKTAARGNPFADASGKSRTVFDLRPQMSSLQAVSVLNKLESVLHYKPSRSVIKPGGYQSRDEFINDLKTKLEKEFGRKA